MIVIVIISVLVSCPELLLAPWTIQSISLDITLSGCPLLETALPSGLETFFEYCIANICLTDILFSGWF